jgi:hypothetical protein
MSNKHVKTGSTSLAIKEVQTKVTLRFHLTPVRMATINNTTTTNAGEDVGERSFYTIVGRNVN